MPGKANFYTPNSMDTAVVLSVTSEAAGHPIESALDRQLYTYREPTTTGSQAIVLDLQNGRHERILDAADRVFTSANHWANGGFAFGTWTITGGQMPWEASESGQYCELAAAGLSALIPGETYRLTYTATGVSSISQFRTGDAQTIGPINSGTANTIDFVANSAATTLQVYSSSLGGAGTLDNLSLKRVISSPDVSIKGFALWIYNARSYFGASCGALLQYSDDNTNWTTFADPDIEDEMTYGDPGEPLRVYISGSAAVSARYWKLTIHDMSTVIKVAAFFLLTQFAPDAYSTYPQVEEEITFRNRKVRLDDGRLSIEPGGYTPVKTFARSFSFFGTTKYTALRNMFRATRGGAIPLIFVEDSIYYLVYLVTEDWKAKATEYLFYQVTLEFETLPYVADGDTI